ncbi:monooxygenase [Rhodococcus rhodochrous]|uniref:flavin reductase n=1 Tax=Rhodococcus rhodochrous TaxID=1829 RepID=UPI0007CD5B61|nr:flavin reductase [Rhodococcus rhodochrous]MDO1484631.1 hypothetical protein [Rhodococcus rhodochrous]SNV27213.1 monooxygenase [Rhodococcus rhodochrous]
MRATPAVSDRTSDYVVVDPAHDTREFRNALSRYATGVAVVTTTADGEPTGMTVNSFAAVSLDPPLILWSVRSDSSRAGVYTSADAFAVNVLSSDQTDISNVFASASSGTEGFRTFSWSRGSKSVPLIDGAIARFECRVHAVFPGGDHDIIVGEVDECSLVDGESLLFVQGGYATPQQMTSPTDNCKEAGGEMDPASAEPSFAQVLTAASHRLSRRFDEHRAQFGLSVASARVLQRLSCGSRTVQELAVSAYLGPRATEDAVSELIESGLVVRNEDRFSLSTDGSATYEQIAEIARRFNRDALADLDDSDVAATRRVLEALARS